ncbi:MAG: HAMP domain-containing sensor histidine kinase [Methylovulum sp.]|uniref:sensor histidine kinase n=1 Tax=Methylovulum sp. TaxID=1916980 RepID=UPI002602E665|nr:HAMP domain-containing sensor histidine kinase [Methylovulum sp.]MDD2722646.1 HAMP domain-containing sensor histidine kinase [Methylovulum sp.]MDD5123882.1 HAMP domain-containing sensor histidine kinase [Methylovulum sp.]
MKRVNFIRASSFKLSALYLGLFLCSFLAIGLSVYFLTIHSLEQQLKDGVVTEAKRLQAEYAVGGMEALLEEIAEDERGAMDNYGLMDQQGRNLAGSLKNFKANAGWQMLSEDSFYVFVIALPNRHWLAVGHSGGTIQNTGTAIIEAFLSGILLVVVLGLGGGFYLSHAFLRKIQAITLATEAIISGDLHRRLPVTDHRDELDQLAALLNQMLDKIGALLDNVQQVSNDIAHDLRTPISRLQFRLQDALKKPLATAQYQEHIASASAEVDTILATFSALLRIAQIETGTRRSGFSPVNFSELVLAVSDALSPVAEEQGKALHADISPDLTMIGDKELLTQLVFNLLENAILHTPAQTRIDIGLQVSGSHLELMIADNGPGIAKADRQKVLQRFYRLEQSRTTPGNGLGLSIAAAIVELHGGSLTLLDNQPGLRLVLLFVPQY